LCQEVKPLNNEDVMPTWTRTLLLRLFPPAANQQHPARLKIRICGDCNDRMGSLYENAAAPLLTPMMSGLARSLTVEQEATASAWIIKTTLLFAIRAAVSARLTCEPQRTVLVEMNKEGTPPQGSSVRVGQFPPLSDPTVDAPADLSRLLPGGPPRQIQTFGIHSLGYLAFEVVVASPRETLDFMARSEQSDRLLRIWPPDLRGVEYPPHQVVTKTDLAALRGAFTAVAEANPGVRIREMWGPDL
jgi:hypothetical protein